MLTKKQFTEILTIIQEDNSNINRLDRIFHDSMKNDFVCGAAFFNPRLTSAIISFIDSQFSPECDWVAYWVHDLNCGQNAEAMQVETDDGHFIKLETIDDLWDWCTSCFGEPI